MCPLLVLKACPLSWSLEHRISPWIHNFNSTPIHMTPNYSKMYIFHEGNSPHLLMTNSKNSTSSFFILVQSMPSDQLLKTHALVAGSLVTPVPLPAL